MSVGTDSIKRAVVKKTETEKKKTGKKPAETKSVETKSLEVKSSVIPKAAEIEKPDEAGNKVYRITDELPIYLL